MRFPGAREHTSVDPSDASLAQVRLRDPETELVANLAGVIVGATGMAALDDFDAWRAA
jgi:surface antigen